MAKRFGPLFILLGFGAVVATVGAPGHRFAPYWGIAMCLLLVCFSGLFARIWQNWWGIIAFSIGWVIVTSIFATSDSGGSVVIAGDALGMIWVYGAVVVLTVVSVVPRTLWMGNHVSQTGN